MTPLDSLATPCFVIREADLLRNLSRVAALKERSGAKIVFALKCFSTWGVFDIIRPYLDGTTSSSVYEARLGAEYFGGETHAFSVGFSAEDVREITTFSNKIIFNSLSQVERHRALVPADVSIGLRVNPERSYASQDLADPARPFSRLGSRTADLVGAPLERVVGAMFHMNCENSDFDAYSALLDHLDATCSSFLAALEWVSLGGGLAFTDDGYPLDALADRLARFAATHGVQVYLEPGEAIVTRTTDMVVTVLDIVHNGGKSTAIVDSATEAHRLDTLIFGEPPKIREASPNGTHEYFIGSCSCLAGDIFCETRFDRPLHVGDRLHVLDSAGYTMVKLNWFNGLRMPAVHCQRVDGRIETLNEFGYDDFVRALSTRSVTSSASAP